MKYVYEYFNIIQDAIIRMDALIDDKTKREIMTCDIEELYIFETPLYSLMEKHILSPESEISDILAIGEVGTYQDAFLFLMRIYYIYLRNK